MVYTPVLLNPLNSVLNFHLVDRILKKQRSDREAAERTRQEQANEDEKLLSDMQPNGPMHNPPPIPGSSAELVGQRARDFPAMPSGSSVANDNQNQRPLSGLSNQLQSWRRKFTATPTKGEASRPSVTNAQAGPSRPNSPDNGVRSTARPPSPELPQLPPMPGALPEGQFSGLGDTRDPIARRPRSSQGHVTSLNNIGKYI